MSHNNRLKMSSSPTTGVVLTIVIVLLSSCDLSLCLKNSASSSSSSSSSSSTPNHHYATQRLGRQLHDPVEDISSPSVNLPCLKIGTYMRHPKDCSRFYRCVEEPTSSSSVSSNSAIVSSNNKTTRYKFQYECPAGLIFDESSQLCNWPSWSSSCTGSGEILHAPRSKFSCPSYGYFQDPHDCQYFYYCSDFGKGSAFEPYEFKCPFDLAFDEEKLLCNWKWLVKGCKEATKPHPDHTPGNPAANFAGHLLDGNTGSIKTSGQGIDGDQDDQLEKRSDDLGADDDIEFVDSPAEHRSHEGLISSKNSEGGRRSFARALKDAVSGAIEAASSRVKSLIGIESEVKASEASSNATVKAVNGTSTITSSLPGKDGKTDKPEKRQDHLIDPVFLAEESIISNLFAGINPFGSLEKSKDRKSSDSGIFKDHKLSGKDHFISIPIIEVAEGGRNRKKNTNKNSSKIKQQQQLLNQLEEIRLLEQLAASSRAPLRHYTPVPNIRERSTYRPKKASTLELIPVPILTIRQTPKPEFANQRIRLQEQPSIPHHSIHQQHPHHGIPIPAPPIKPHKNRNQQQHIQRPSPSPNHPNNIRGVRPEPEPKPESKPSRHHIPRVQIIPLPEPEPLKNVHHQRQESPSRRPSSQRNAGQRPVRPSQKQQRPPLERLPVERLPVERVVERPIDRQPIDHLKQESSRHDRHPIDRHPVPEKAPRPKKPADRIPVERPVERPVVDVREPYLPAPSIALHSREVYPRQNQVHHKRQKNKSTSRPASSANIGSIQAQLPPELFANYDVDIKPLSVHPIISPGGALDYAQLSLVPLNGGEPLGHHAQQQPATRGPKPFGMPAPLGQRTRQKEKNRNRQPSLSHPKNIPVPRPQTSRKPVQQPQQHHVQHAPQPVVHHLEVPVAPRPSHPVEHIPVHHHQQQPPRQQERPLEVHEIHLEPVRTHRLPVEQPSIVPVEHHSEVPVQEVPLRHHVVEHVLHREPQPSIQHHQQSQVPQHISHIHSLLEPQQQPAQVYGPQPQPIENHAHHVVHHQPAPQTPVVPATSHVQATQPAQHPSYGAQYQPQASGSQIHSHYQVNSFEKSHHQQLAPQLHDSYSGLNSISKNGFKPISHPSVVYQVKDNVYKGTPTGYVQYQSSSTSSPFGVSISSKPTFIGIQSTTPSSLTSSYEVVSESVFGNKQIPQSLHESIQQVIAQHLLQQLNNKDTKTTASVQFKSSTSSPPLVVSITSKPTVGIQSTTPSSLTSSEVVSEAILGNKQIPQTLYDSIQQVIAQHLLEQLTKKDNGKTDKNSSIKDKDNIDIGSSESIEAVGETTTVLPTTVSAEISSPSSSSSSIIEQIPFSHYYPGVNGTLDPSSLLAQQQQSWPYSAWFQPPVYANPYYPPPPPPPAPVYAPHLPLNQTNQYFPYPSYGPYGSWAGNTGANGSANPFSGWYEWAYGSQQQQTSASSPVPVSPVPSSSTPNNELPTKPPTSYFVTITTTAAPSTSGQKESVTASPQITSVHVKEVERITTKVYDGNTKPITTTPSTPSDSNGEAPQIQVYIVQGPNGPQVQTKTANNKDGNKAPNVQVYVIDENNKEKPVSYTPGGYGTRTKPGKNQGGHDNYYEYNHQTGVNYQSEESQLNHKTTLPPDFGSDDDIFYQDVYRGSASSNVKVASTTRRPAVKANKNKIEQPSKQQPESSKAPSLQSIYNSIGLKNFTDGLVPEAACSRPGLFQHPNDCNKFYECYFDRFVNGYTVHLFECPVKLAFDSRIIGCTGPTDPTVCVQY